ncbi:MAG: hypothetical protein ACYTXT_39545 [Nostoc sp.]
MQTDFFYRLRSPQLPNCHPDCVVCTLNQWHISELTSHSQPKRSKQLLKKNSAILNEDALYVRAACRRQTLKANEDSLAAGAIHYEVQNTFPVFWLLTPEFCFDKFAPKGDRSRFIHAAIQAYITQIQTEKLRQRID